jgi:hypothetical protein|nr:MAG TPA: hypothetical protein [Caudoviricetes sp.]
MAEGKLILGKVAFVDKGTYSAAATYNTFDFVVTEDSCYLCVKDGCKGIALTDTTWWKCIARGTQATAAAKNANDAANLANQKAGAADSAAGNAVTATNNANAKANEAAEKAGLADAAASKANVATGDARVVITRLEDLEDTLVSKYKLVPTSMLLTYPKKVTMRNTQTLKIQFELLPVNTGRNVLFLGDDRAITVSPDGSFTIKQVGMSKVHVIPTENTALYQTIQINVEEPGMRFTSGRGIRFSGSGGIKLT